MLANYWPWSFKTENPRGFNNMNCHDIYPQEDFEKVISPLNEYTKNEIYIC